MLQQRELVSLAVYFRQQTRTHQRRLTGARSAEHRQETVWARVEGFIVSPCVTNENIVFFIVHGLSIENLMVNIMLKNPWIIQYNNIIH